MTVILTLNVQTGNMNQLQKGASVGAGSVLISGITVGENALIGAGSVVARNVPDGTIVYGEKAVSRREVP
jgi:acetyltransferase-like isoleucine patch superfamily enzyme